MTAVVTVKAWWKRHAGWLAVVFAVVALVLGVVVIAQALMLYWRGWRFALGTIPEWLAGAGSIAVFATLWVTVSEWRHARRERRDQLANQARGIIVEPWVPPSSMPRQEPNGRYVVIRNHSTQPVLNLRAEHLTLRDKFTNFRQVDPTTGDHTLPPSLVPVLAPGEATNPFLARERPVGATVTEYLFFQLYRCAGRGLGTARK